MQLEPGSRCLLLGSNGAGKTTLLNLLSGKHIHAPNQVMVLGRPAFHNTHPGIQAITGNWATTQAYTAYEVPYTKDISVQSMLDGVPDKDPARVDEIIKVLDVDLKWRMHIVSDGQRRRVQLLMGMIKPFEVLLLDEVTVDLDVVARADLLTYLRKECETRGATIVYATHIFDGLERWASHIGRITSGVMVKCGPLEAYDDFQALLASKAKSPLLKCVMAWLREERQQFNEKKRKEQESGMDLEEEGETDLKLVKHAPGTSARDRAMGIPFAHNRMANPTCC